MFSCKTLVATICRSVSVLTIFSLALSLAYADVSVSYVHHPSVPVPPGYYGPPSPAYDTVYYSANSTTATFDGYTLSLKDWGTTEPNAGSDPGSDGTITGSTGSAPGSGSAQTNCPSLDFRPYTYVKDGLWIAYHIRAIPHNGGQAVDSFSSWYKYYEFNN